MDECGIPDSGVRIKWLQLLLGVSVASLVNSLINYVHIVSADLTTWVSRGILVAVIICMFGLSPASRHYQWAAVSRGLWLGTLILGTVLRLSSVLILGTSILSLLAVYQEYQGHSELIVRLDPVLAKRWRGLFLWSFLAPLLLSIGSSAAVVVATFMNLDAVKVTAITTGVMRIPQYIVDIHYLLYMRKMILVLEESEGM